MKKLVFDDERLISEAEIILDEIGIDITTAVRTMLKRVIRERGAAFLFNDNSVPAAGNTEQEDVSVSETVHDNHSKMTKNKAIVLLKSKGVSIGENVTFSSKNKNSHNYWANPSFNVLNKNWFLILNDWSKRELHLFVIPAKTYSRSKLVSRADKDLIDLQIMSGDESFTDIRSKTSFAKYRVKKISY